MKAPASIRAAEPHALPLPPASNGVPVPSRDEGSGARPLNSAFRVGRYEVDARIATGGMATVHLGRVLGAAGFSRIVAIKRLLPQFAADPEFESMFVTEAQLAARIHHPNVVPTLDVVSADGELLLVMEYVAGESLSRLSAKARAANDMPQPVALAIICDALHGLHAAHEAKDRHGHPLGVVHRDMSPQNVIVGVDGVSRVIDFGIAKAANSANITRDGMVRGKAAYMAPEQLGCEPLTRRADLYAIGIMLWELLVGERLFPGGSRPDLLAKAEGFVPRPSSRVPALSPRLDDVVMRALALSEADRFVTALDMVQALESSAAIAPRSHVAEWVERHAEAALAERAALLAHLESMARSVPPPAMAATEPSSRVTLPLAGMKAPAVPSITVPNLAFTPPGSAEDTEHAQEGQHKRRAPWIAAAVAVGLASVVTAAFALRAARAPDLPPATPRPHAAAPPPLSEKGAAGAILAPPPTALAAGTKAPPAPALELAAPKPGAVEPLARKAGASPPRSRPQARAAVKPTVGTKPSANAKACTPPYTTDAQGRRKYKAECF